MHNYLMIIVILYNLNILLNTYGELMINNITLFNYKNTPKYNHNLPFFDIILNNTYSKNLYLKIAL